MTSRIDVGAIFWTLVAAVLAWRLFHRWEASVLIAVNTAFIWRGIDRCWDGTKKCA